MMLSCRDVTRRISESMDRTLPVGERIGVRLHLLICRFCARYERQLLLIRGAVPGSRGGDVAVYPAVKARKSSAPAKAAKPAASK